MAPRFEQPVARLFIAVPVIGLVLCALSWLRYGIDFPLWDDWRAYRLDEVGSLDPADLFRPANDTLYPVGKFLDSLAFRFLDGNTIAYQFLSMICVLGSLLLLQWKLLVLALRDRLKAAAAFSFTIFMLQPGGYWGLQNIAYHQAIPLICILFALLIVLQDEWQGTIGAPLLFVLGAISGLTYISGAFAALIAGALFLLCGLMFAKPERRRFIEGGGALLLAGIATSVAQLRVIIVVQQGTHRPDAPMAYPHESDFWLYMLGKIGRALMLPMDRPATSMAITLVVVVTFIALAGWSLWTFAASRPLRLADLRTRIVFCTLLAVVFAYLLLVSAGRTNLRPAGMTGALQIFSFGFHRFHFFWVTLLFPWAAALLIASADGYASPRFANKGQIAALVLALIALPHALGAGAMKHGRFFRYTMEQRVEALKCMSIQRQIGRDTPCLNAVLSFPFAGFEIGRKNGASFARIVPLLPLAMGTTVPPPLYRLGPADWTQTTQEDVEITSTGAQGIELSSRADAKLFFKTGATGEMARCTTLEAAISIRVSADDVAQLFFRTRDQAGFSEASSLTASVLKGDGFRQAVFQVTSPTGFKDEFRLDPVSRPQQFSLQALEVRCRESNILDDMPSEDKDGETFLLQASPPLAQARAKLSVSAAHRAEKMPLRKIAILFGTYARQNKGNAELRLTAEDGTVFASRFELRDLKDNRYREFAVDPGRYVSAEIVPVSGGGVSIWESVNQTGSIASCMVYEYSSGQMRFTPGCPSN